MIILLFTVSVCVHVLPLLARADDACATTRTSLDDVTSCIRSKQQNVSGIINYLVSGQGQGLTYAYLRNVTDSFGHRTIASHSLNASLRYYQDLLSEKNADGLPLADNVTTQEVTTAGWIRGPESLRVVSGGGAGFASGQQLDVLGLGMTVSTPDGTAVTADVVTVASFDDLATKNVTGKVVVYNFEWTTYAERVIYRLDGADAASRLGAIGVLVRSLTPLSLYTVHTGDVEYTCGDDCLRIPAASITVEDAEMFARMQEIGEVVRVSFSMNHTTVQNVLNYNLVAELRGRELPDEYVVFGAHLDSWDVGTGAMDDAGGCQIGVTVFQVLRALRLRPKRTLRLVLFTAEETGFWGGLKHFERYKNESDSISLIMESDVGSFRPYGLGLTANATARRLLQEILDLTRDIGTTQLADTHSGPDIAEWVKIGVPAASPLVDDDRYFWYHHTKADTITMTSSEDLDLVAALWASVAYTVADLSIMLPREDYFVGSALSTSYSQSKIILVVSMVILKKFI